MTLPYSNNADNNAVHLECVQNSSSRFWSLVADCSNRIVGCHNLHQHDRGSGMHSTDFALLRIAQKILFSTWSVFKIALSNLGV